MNWYKYSESESFDKSIKNFVKNDPFCQRLFKEYCISMDELNNVQFIAKPLKKKYAISNSKYIIINKNIIDENFLKEKFHFVLHELVHFLTRKKEQNIYFSDPEELEAFSIAMCYEMLRGKNEKEIREEFFPIIKAHFEKNPNAEQLYKALLQKALLRKQKYEKLV